MSNKVLIDVVNLESGLRGYLLVGDKLFLEHYNGSAAAIHSNLDVLAALTKDNQEQQGRIGELKRGATERLASTNKIIEFFDRGLLKKEDINDILYKSNTQSNKLRGILANINLEEEKLLDQRRTEAEKSNRNTTWLYFLPIAIILLIVTLFVISLVYRQTELKLADELT